METEHFGFAEGANLPPLIGGSESMRGIEDERYSALRSYLLESSDRAWLPPYVNAENGRSLR
jgi:hypothetical protein